MGITPTAKTLRFLLRCSLAATLSYNACAAANPLANGQPPAKLPDLVTSSATSTP